VDEALDDASHIQQPIDLTVRIQHRLWQLLDSCQVGDVDHMAGQPAGRWPGQCLCLSESLRAEVNSGDPGAALQQEQHDLASDPVAASGHDEYLACHVHDGLLSRLWVGRAHRAPAPAGHRCPASPGCLPATVVAATAANQLRISCSDALVRRGRLERHEKKTGAIGLNNEASEAELEKLHAELVAMQEWVKKSGARIVIVFEGRDTAGKGGVIKRLTERVSHRVFREVALPAPSDREKSQMYMQRYMAHLPAAGEVVIFDRSWYNRVGVERVMGWASPEQVQQFFDLAPLMEKVMVDGGIILLKY